jgi:hypothetical protein
MAKACKIKDCQRPHAARGYCATHYYWLRRSKERPRCSIEGCEGCSYARSWCPMHYARRQRHGDPMEVQVVATSCSVEGCRRDHYSHGLCQLHLSRLKRTGTTDAPRWRIACSVTGCDRDHYGKGLCMKHWQQQRRRKMSREDLSAAFLTALNEDYARSGEQALERVRSEEPAKYLALVSALVPRASPAEKEDSHFEKMSAQELREHIAKLPSDDAILGLYRMTASAT